jgi:hypothetical protein
VKAAALTLVIVIACTLAFLFQPSQPPSPTPTKPTQDNQGKSAGKDSVGPSNQGDTNSISAAIDKLKSELASWKNQQATENSQKNTSPNGWLKWSTIITAIATLAIAGLGIFQGWAMHRQRLAMEEQAKYMSDGLVETRKAANAATESAKAARDALVLANRPYLDVKGFEIEDLNLRTEDLPMLKITCKVFNPSNTPANVSHVDAFGRIGFGFDMDSLITNKVNHTQLLIAPRRGYWFPMTFKQLTPTQRDLYIDKQLIIDLRLRVTFTDPFGVEMFGQFDRTCVCGPLGYIKAHLQINSPFDPWPPEEKKN